MAVPLSGGAAERELGGAPARFFTPRLPAAGDLFPPRKRELVPQAGLPSLVEYRRRPVESSKTFSTISVWNLPSGASRP